MITLKFSGFGKYMCSACTPSNQKHYNMRDALEHMKYHDARGQGVDPKCRAALQQLADAEDTFAMVLGSK